MNSTPVPQELMRLAAGSNTQFITALPGGSSLMSGDFDAGSLEIDGDLTVTGTSQLDGNVTIGDGSAGVDFTLTFNGEDNDGVITWDEDNSKFDFGSANLSTTGETDLDLWTFEKTTIGVNTFPTQTPTGATKSGLLFGGLNILNASGTTSSFVTLAKDDLTDYFQFEFDNTGVDLALTAIGLVNPTFSITADMNLTGDYTQASGVMDVTGPNGSSDHAPDVLTVVGGDGGTGGKDGSDINFTTGDGSSGLPFVAGGDGGDFVVNLGSGGTGTSSGADGAFTVNGVTVFNGNVTIGTGAAGVDYTLTFNGEDNDCVVTWKEDEAVLYTTSTVEVGALTMNTMRLGEYNGNDAWIFNYPTNSAIIQYNGTHLVINPRAAGTGSVIIGEGGAGVDYVLGFNGETNDGNMTWMEDEAEFSFDSRINATAGIKTKYSENNITVPPTDAELDTAFGTPAALGSGFIGVIDDNSADTDVYICFTNDVSWWYIKGTKAT